MKYYKRSILLLVSLFVSASVFCQRSSEFRNATPRQTVESHFDFLKNPLYNPTIASYTLGETSFSRSKNEMLIIKLKEILEKKNIDISNISNRRWGVVNENKYVLFTDMPKIYLERIDKAWVYSKETVRAINSIHDSFVLHIEDASETASEIFHVISADTTDAFKFSLESPYHTIVSHFVFLTDSLFDPTLAAKTIHFSENDTSQAESMAVKLNQIFMGTSEDVFQVESISKDPNYLDSVSQKHIYHPNPEFKELYLEKVGENWLYSVATSRLINSAHKEMFDEDAEQIFSFSDRFKRSAGENYRKVIFGLEYWQILMFLFFIGLAAAIWLIFFFGVKRLIALIIRKERYHETVYRLLRSIGLLIFLDYLNLYTPSFDLQIEYMSVLHNVVDVLDIFVKTMLIIHIINLLKLYMTRTSAVNSKIGLFLFLSIILKIFIFVGSLLFVIDELGYNLVNVLAGLSIGGLAIALGAQDTIKNFFGSLMIFADRPFQVGDFIQEGDVLGTVEEVGIRTTRIRTSYNSIVSMPNSKLTDNNIDNLGKRDFRRFRSILVLDYNTSSETIQTFVDRLKKEVEGHPNTRKDFYVIDMHDFSLHGIEVLINVFFKVPTWRDEMDARHTFMIKVIEVAKELDIKFAQPVRA